MAVSGTGECDDVRQALGVYVLGAVEPADRRLIDQHLTGCARCRNELAGLAGLPALLGKVSADEVASVVAADALAVRERSWPSSHALRSQLARVARIRRNHLLAWIGAAAIAGAAAGSVAVAAWHVRQPASRRPLAHQISSQTPSVRVPEYVTLTRVTNPRTGVSATVRYAPREWGLRLGVRVIGVALGMPCQLEVIDTFGRETTTGSWTVVRDASTWYIGSSWLSIGDVSSFVVASSAGKPLVVIPVRESAPRHGDGGRQARLLPHDRRSAPTFGVISPPPRSGHQGAGSVQMTSGNRSAIRTGSSGNATDLVLADPVIHSSCLLRS